MEKQTRAEILKADGTRTAVEPRNGKTFELVQLQEIVGGLIEIIHLQDGRLMILNEEGKLKRLALNRIATALARGTILAYDHICGDVLVCEERQLD